MHNTTNDFGQLDETKKFMSNNFEMKDMGGKIYMIWNIYFL